MPIFWSIILTIGLGIICGAWMPVLPFIFIFTISSFAVGVSTYLSSSSISLTILSSVCVAVMLQVSYVIGMFVFNMTVKYFVHKKDMSHKSQQKLNADIPPNT